MYEHDGFGINEALRAENPFINSQAVDDDGSEDDEPMDYGSQIPPNTPFPRQTKVFSKSMAYVVNYCNKKDFVEEHKASSVGIAVFTTAIARRRLYEAMEKVYNTPGIFLNGAVAPKNFQKNFFRMQYALHGYGFDHFFMPQKH